MFKIKSKPESKLEPKLKELSSNEDVSGADSLLDSTKSKDSSTLDNVEDTTISTDDESSISTIKQCIKNEGSPKPRAPSPPDSLDSSIKRSSSFTQGTNVKSTAVVKYTRPSPFHYKFLQLSYNTNLKRPPENWLRMRTGSIGAGAGQSHYSGRFGSYFWSYPFSKSTSWSMFSSFRYGMRGRRGARMGRFQSLCLCCGCCNCSRIYQTYCCCCFHCVHTISSCRRSDLVKSKLSPEHKAINPAAPSASLNTGTGPESGLESGTESLSNSISNRNSKHKSRSSSRKGSSKTMKSVEKSI